MPSFRGRNLRARPPGLRDGVHPGSIEHVISPYRLLRAPLFGLPPETAHEIALGVLETALASSAARRAARARFAVATPELRSERWGIEFPNPVGLAAGFDKAGRAFNALGALGFGFIEIGTVTALAQPGNPRPRLFRLPKDGALVNRMGFNNPGAEAVAARLRRTRIEPVLGINVGKSKAAALEDATEDYLRSVDLLLPFADYLVVNVSSPNTPGLRTLQDAEPLRALLGAIVGRVAASGRGAPVLVKLAPDLGDAQIEEAVGIARETGVAGVVAVNTTISREGLRTPSSRLESIGAGGLSGRPLRQRALDVVRLIRRATSGALPVVGVGGISSAEDAWRQIRAGASLVQVYTGFIYEGPGMVRRINLGLLERLRREGMRSLDEAVGSGS